MLKATLFIAAALAAAGQAQAGVIVDVTGTAARMGSFSSFQVPTPVPALGPGSYSISFSFDRDQRSLRLESFVAISYDYVCRGNPPFLCGGSDSTRALALTRNDARHYTATFTLAPAYTVPAAPNDPIFLETRYRPERFDGQFGEAIDVEEPTLDNPVLPPLHYRIIISSVPEPASWALMIAGFGLAGAAMRRRTPTLSRAGRGRLPRA